MEVGMSWKITISLEEADKLLAKAEPRLEFVNTVMGIINLDGKSVAFGRRYFKGMHPDYFQKVGLLGPDSIDIPEDEKFATPHLASVLEKTTRYGLMNKFEAVVTDSYATYTVFKEGLILNNHLGPMVDGVFEGKILINGNYYKLWVVDGNGVFGHGFNTIFVDANRCLLDI